MKLSKKELEFFTELEKARNESNLPGVFKNRKSSGGEISVYYEESADSCYVGRIKITNPIISYSVLKEGNQKASKIFKNKKDALKYVKERPKFSYEIIEIVYNEESFIQYTTSLDSDPEYIYSENHQELTSYIPEWIKYIQKIRKDFY